MLFSSLTFLLIFLPLCLFCYFLSPNIKIKNGILLLFSLIFYSWGEPTYILLMIGTILITYFLGLKISQNKGVKRKRYFILTIILLLLNLFFFKYYNFFMENVKSILRISIKEINIPLPIGISFYTFQALSYIIDLYKKKIKVQKSIAKVALYISLFPQLIAGPIVRYETIEKEISERKSTLENTVLGLKRFIIGLSKKVLLANNMALIADTIWKEPNAYGTFFLWIAAIAFTLQIYYDFSGYSDMAIGLGKIFGFTFLENFNAPYISKSITEFWRRWHISLSSWFKDYVYIPLGGSRVSIKKQIRNILVVWFLTGLWHGASWNYIIWGMYFALLLLIEKFILKDKINKIPTIIRHIITMILVINSWVIFKIESLPNLLVILKNMWTIKKGLPFFSQNAYLIMNFYFLIPCLLFIIPWKKKNKQDSILIDGLYFILFIINILFIIGNSYNPFIYFRF